MFPIFVIINDIFMNTLVTKTSSAFQSLSVDWQSPTSGSSRFKGTTCLRFLILKIVFGMCGTGLNVLTVWESDSHTRSPDRFISEGPRAAHGSSLPPA